MELDRITKESALYGKRCRLCKRRYKLGDMILVDYVPTGLIFVSWHADCVQVLIDPNWLIPVIPQAEIDAFVVRETARMKARSA